MRRFVAILCLLVVALHLTACGKEIFADDQVYIVEQGEKMEENAVVGWLDIHAAAPFAAETVYQQQLGDEKIFLTASADGQKIFYEERAAEQNTAILKGPGQTLVNLYLIDQTRQTITLLAEKRPFITGTGWNEDGTMAAFSGEGALTVYDLQKQKCVLTEELAEETVTAFFWSPLESRKLYLEQPRNAIGSLYYMEPQKKVELYETTEQLYCRAKLDENYYYGIRWGMDQEKQEAIYTVLANRDKETVKVIGRGSYRDHYLRSVLLSRENNFGLTYIANINQVSKTVTLTEEYVYDAKFAAGGRIVYITGGARPDSNLYTLHVLNNAGEELWQQQISGSGLLLSEDGKIGYSSGPAQEQIFFERQILQKGQQNATDDNFTAVLRGAGSVYARLLLGQTVETEEQESYYANLEGLKQLQKTQAVTEEPAAFWMRTLLIEDNAQGKLCTVYIEGQTSSQQWLQQKVQFQMIEKDQRWFVLHFKAGEIGEDT